MSALQTYKRKVNDFREERLILQDKIDALNEALHRPYDVIKAGDIARELRRFLKNEPAQNLIISRLSQENT